MKTSIGVLLTLLLACISCSQYKKNLHGHSKTSIRSKHHKNKQRQVNDDERQLVTILQKIAGGAKEGETKSHTVIRKSEQFQSMEDLHALDFEKLGEVRQGYVLRVVRDKDTDIQLKANKLKTVTLEPVFLVVNTQTVSLYQNENINSLTDSLPLKDLECKLLVSKDRQASE